MAFTSTRKKDPSAITLVVIPVCVVAAFVVEGGTMQAQRADSHKVSGLGFIIEALDAFFN